MTCLPFLHYPLGVCAPMCVCVCVCVCYTCLHVHDEIMKYILLSSFSKKKKKKKLGNDTNVLALASRSDLNCLFLCATRHVPSSVDKIKRQSQQGYRSTNCVTDDSLVIAGKTQGSLFSPISVEFKI